MTLLEVIDDAVKIGLGSLTGWLIARGSRSHEFEKERRRRKQDLLEHVMGEFDNFVVVFQEGLKYALARNELPISADSNPVIEERLDRALEQMSESEKQLAKLPGRLRMMQFKDCADMLQRTILQGLVLRRSIILASRGGANYDSLQNDFQPFLLKANEFRGLMVDHYSKL